MRHPLTLPVILLLMVASGSMIISGSEPGTVTRPIITIFPAPRSADARPDRRVRVTVTGGRLTGVRVSTGTAGVPGDYDRGHHTWRSRWTLAPATGYVVTATASPATLGDPPVEVTTTFRTRPAPRVFGIQQMIPGPAETVGVGMPIILTFTAPVRNRAAVERAIEVRAARPVPGAWRWVSDTQVVYRTRRYWPARQKVVLTAHLAGVRGAPKTYGTADRTLEFSVGRHQVSEVDTLTHRMLVHRDGRLVQHMPISAGNATTREYTTTSGIHVTMDKGDPVRMVSPGRRKGDPGYYDLMIRHAVRISNSGEYVHAKDNLWAQGRVNVSHGCVNARPDQAAWFFATSLRGDPVIVSGTDRALEWWNGWGHWQLSWAEWRKGSALRHRQKLTLPSLEKRVYGGSREPPRTDPR